MTERLRALIRSLLKDVTPGVFLLKIAPDCVRRNVTKREDAGLPSVKAWADLIA